MAKIYVKDLADSIELDQQAMSVIFGGARTTRAGAQFKQQLQNSAKATLMGQARAKQRRGR